MINALDFKETLDVGICDQWQPEKVLTYLIKIDKKKAQRRSVQNKSETETT